MLYTVEICDVYTHDFTWLYWTYTGKKQYALRNENELFSVYEKTFT